VGGVPDALRIPCLAGFLFRDQLATEPPGQAGNGRTLYFRELDRSVESCPNLLAPDHLNAANGQEDVLLMTLRPRGKDEETDEVEAVLTGSLGMFVTAGTTPAGVEKVRREYGPKTGPN
jgi:hypothetical protein